MGELVFFAVESNELVSNFGLFAMREADVYVLAAAAEEEDMDV